MLEGHFISHVSFLPVTTASSAVSGLTVRMEMCIMFTGRSRHAFCCALLKPRDSAVKMLKILLNNNGEQES
jgi:hypothetical protein